MLTFEVTVLQDGYSFNDKKTGIMIANGTSTLIRGGSITMLVDTLSPWDREHLLDKLKEYNLSPKGEHVFILMCLSSIRYYEASCM